MSIRGLTAALGAVFSAAIVAPFARAAEWERIEADLIAVTGSRVEALRMAECAIEAAKAGVESPEHLAHLIRTAYLEGHHHARDLRVLRRSIDGMLESGGYS